MGSQPELSYTERISLRGSGCISSRSSLLPLGSPPNKARLTSCPSGLRTLMAAIVLSSLGDCNSLSLFISLNHARVTVNSPFVKSYLPIQVVSSRSCWDPDSYIHPDSFPTQGKQTNKKFPVGVSNQSFLAHSSCSIRIY